MKLRWSKIPIQFRLIIIGLTIALFFWIPIEDHTATISILFALAFCTIFAALILKSSSKQYRASLLTYFLLGILAGAAVTPIALFFMVLKTGLHTHPIPDYSKFQVISVFKRSPVWIIGGSLISMGLGIYYKTHVFDPE